MNIKINGLNLKITEGMETAIHNKLSCIEKFIGNNEISVKITQKKLEVKVVIMLVYNHQFVKITERDNDFYVALDKAGDTLKNQIHKIHELKVKRENDQSETIRTYFDNNVEEEDFDVPKIVKRKHFELVPITEDEAIDEMIILGHKNFVFLNIETNSVCMLYIRNDGDYGLINFG